MTKKERNLLIRILLATLLLILSIFVPVPNLWKLCFFVPAYLLVGGEILKKALRNIFRGQIFDENFLMSIATLGAFATGEYLEGVLVMLLYQIGELFQSYAVGKSRKSIAHLMDIRPDYVNIEIDGKLQKVDPEEVHVGDMIIIKPGEKIALDGVVQMGSSFIDTSALTGESVPRKVEVGSPVLSGCMNKSGLLTVQVEKEFEESTVSKILDLVENASSKKAKTENFITKFARYYTPIVVFSALALTFLPPLFISHLTVLECMKRALTFLVISCPCALVISVPLGFFGGIGGASKNGILIKGSNYLEALSRVKTVVFDKTGTLTKGTFTVTKIQPDHCKKEELLEIAALVESYSQHPIAESIRTFYGKKIDTQRVSDVQEIAGNGVSAIVDGKEVFAGNLNLMEKIGITDLEQNFVGTVVYVAIEGQYAGYLLIADEIKKEAGPAICDMRRHHHIEKVIMLTGDSYNTASAVAKELQLDAFYANLLPDEKVAKVEELLNLKDRHNLVAFVGDGMNDAPVLGLTDVGIAMGGLGTDAAIEASDVVIMNDDLSKINTAFYIAKRTIRIVQENIWFAIGVKIFFLLMGAFGMANMMEAVFADVGVSILAILNSMRALYIKQKK